MNRRSLFGRLAGALLALIPGSAALAAPSHRNLYRASRPFLPPGTRVILLESPDGLHDELSIALPDGGRCGYDELASVLRRQRNPALPWVRRCVFSSGPPVYYRSAVRPLKPHRPVPECDSLD